MGSWEGPWAGSQASAKGNIFSTAWWLQHLFSLYLICLQRCWFSFPFLESPQIDVHIPPSCFLSFLNQIEQYELSPFVLNMPIVHYAPSRMLNFIVAGRCYRAPTERPKSLSFLSYIIRFPYLFLPRLKWSMYLRNLSREKREKQPSYHKFMQLIAKGYSNCMGLRLEVI